MESRLLEILVCPLCKGPLQHDRDNNELICQPDKLAFPIRDGIPVMLPDEARVIGSAERSTASQAAPTSEPPAAAHHSDADPS